MKFCEQGVRTLFSSATALIPRQDAEGRLEERLKNLSQAIRRATASPNLFFQLVSRRYERGSIIITSNQSLGAWGEVFDDADRQRHPRPSAPPLDTHQHQRRRLQTLRRRLGPACSNVNSTPSRSHEAQAVLHTAASGNVAPPLSRQHQRRKPTAVLGRSEAN